MDSQATKEARAEALQRAKKNNLDVAVIAKETVRMILEGVFANIPALSSEQPDPANFATGLDERDVYLIRSIEWLTMVPETADEALIQSNAVARYFLAQGQAGAAQALLKTLPATIALVEDDIQGHAYEHEQFKELFAVFAAHDAVDDVLSRQPKNT